MSKSASKRKPQALVGEIVRLSDHPNRLAFNEDGTRLAAHGIQSVHLVDVEARAWSSTIKSNEANAMLFHRDELFVGTKNIGVYDLNTEKKVRSLKGHKAAAHEMALSDDEQTLFTAGGDYIYTDDRFLRAFDPSTGALRWKAKPGKKAGALSVVVIDDRVYVAAEDGYVRVFDAANGTMLEEVQIGPAVEYGSIFGGIARCGRGLVASSITDKGCHLSWISVKPKLSLETTEVIGELSAGVMPPPRVQGGFVLLVSEGRFVVVEVASRTVCGLYEIEWVMDARCVVLSSSGTLAWPSRDGVGLVQLPQLAGTKPARKPAKKAPAKAKASKSVALGKPVGTMFCGTPSREGAFEGKLEAAPKKIWAKADFYSSGDEFGGSVVAGDKIAVGTGSDRVTALQKRNGKKLWSTEAGEKRFYPCSEFSIGHDAVFIAASQGLFAFDQKNGDVLWKARMSGASGAPLLFDDVCVLGANKGLYARKLDTGRAAWTFKVKDKIKNTLAYRDGVFYFYADAQLVALEAASQTVLWSVPSGEPIRSGPVATEELVVCMADVDAIAAFDRKSGKERWRTKTKAILGSFCLATDGKLVVVKDNDGRFHGFDMSSGKKRWTSKAGRKKPYGIGYAGPIIVGDTVVSITVEEDENSCHLTGLALKSGKVRWDLDSEGTDAISGMKQKTKLSSEWSWYSTPHFEDGLLYAQTSAGIVALKP